MADNNFKERLGHWLWKFQNEMDEKERQFAVLDTANRMQKNEDILIEHQKHSGEVLSSTLELQYILSANQNEVACLLGMLIGPDYANDLDEYISFA